MGDGVGGLAGGVGCDGLRRPHSGCDGDHLRRLTRKVGAGSQAVAAVGGGFHSLSIDDLIRKTDLKDGRRKNLAKREDGAFGEHGIENQTSYDIEQAIVPEVSIGTSTEAPPPVGYC